MQYCYTVCLVFLTHQMKSLFCERLAACLCMNQPTFSSAELTFTKHVGAGTRNTDNVDAEYPETSSTETLKDDSTYKLLKSMSDQLKKIRNLLETRANDEEEQRYEAYKENKMKNDWMLAAAVLDRICAIAFVVIFVGGTVVFFVVCDIRP